MFSEVASSACFLPRQGLAFRCDGDEANSNFISLHSEDDSCFSQWVKRKMDKFTSPDIQNEMVKVMAMPILWKIARILHTQ